MGGSSLLQFGKQKLGIKITQISKVWHESCSRSNKEDILKTGELSRQLKNTMLKLTLKIYTKLNMHQQTYE
jgi:hypothetical protein